RGSGHVLLATSGRRGPFPEPGPEGRSEGDRPAPTRPEAKGRSDNRPYVESILSRLVLRILRPEEPRAWSRLSRPLGRTTWTPLKSAPIECDNTVWSPRDPRPDSITPVGQR